MHAMYKKHLKIYVNYINYKQAVCYYLNILTTSM